MNKIVLDRKNTYNTDFLLVSGHSGSGKVLISRILESFENIEKSREDFIFYYLMQLYRFNLIDKESIGTLLKINKDRLMYDQLLGRDMNIRYTDINTVFKHPYPLDYFKRIFRKERNYTHNFIRENKPIFQNMITNATTDCNLFFNTFKDNMKFIYVIRNPIEVIYSLHKRTCIERIGTEPSEVQLTYNWRGNSIPVYAYGWEKEYLMLKPLDKAIRVIDIFTRSDFFGYERLSKSFKKNVLIIDFNKFVINPNEDMDRLLSFLDTKRTWKTSLLLRREKCPRKVDNKGYSMIKRYIYSNCSKDSIDILKNLEEYYEDKTN